jgi:hypothetical protein
MRNILKRIRRKLFGDLITSNLAVISHELRSLEQRMQSYIKQEIDTGVSKIAQRHLYNFYQFSISNGHKHDLRDTGFRCFSQFEEDGKLLYIFAAIGMKNRSFVDLGAWNGINSNCTNLALNFGWSGLFVEGNEERVNEGRCFYQEQPETWVCPPAFENSFITRGNVNKLIEKHGISGEIDFLSLDIDGNDYWVWEALEIVRPRVVLIETNILFGMKSVTIPYSENFRLSSDNPSFHGASVSALFKLGKRKGYKLIGSSRNGINLFFVLEEETKDLFREVTPEEIFEDIKYRKLEHYFKQSENLQLEHV